MLRIEKEQIEHTGGTIENLVDLAIAIDFIYDQLEVELGHKAARKILRKTLSKVFNRKEQSRWNIPKR